MAGSLTEAMTGHLDADGWQYDGVGDDGIAALRFAGDSGTWSIAVQAREEQSQVVCYSLLPGEVPEGNRVAMAELLTRVNYGLIIGNFELDLDTGDVRYKTSVDLGGGELTAEVLRELMRANVDVTDHYLPAVAAVQHAGLGASAALALV